MHGTSSLIPIQSGKVTAYTKAFRYDHAGRLISESNVKTLYGEGSASTSIVYLYDGNTMIGMEYTSVNGTELYFFHRNLQGDVIGIYDTNGNLKVRYIYDAWGNCTIDNTQTTDIVLAKANPIRYRGYYFDVDTGLYYLNARYYSPELRRFISPDDTAYLNPENANGLNLYAYCCNDPVNYADPSGHAIISFIAGIIIGATAGAISAIVSEKDILTGIIIGAISGAISPPAAKYLGEILGAVIMGIVTDLAYQCIMEKKSFDEINLISVLTAGLLNGFLTARVSSLSGQLDDDISMAIKELYETMVGTPLNAFGNTVGLITGMYTSYTVKDLKEDWPHMKTKLTFGR